jgi:hypothetical protein
MKGFTEKFGCNGPEASWLKNTLLFRQWEGMKQEILLHKWYESEKAGYDIGWERAAVDWMIKHGPMCTRQAEENKHF